MKRIAIRLAVATLTLVLGVGSFFALHRVLKQIRRGRVKAEAIKLTNQFHEAAINGDAQSLDNLLGDDFEGVGHTNLGLDVLNKSKQIARSKAGKEAQVAAGDPVPSVILSNVNVHEEGATIVLEADGEMLPHEPGSRFHLIYTFAERQGRLQLISSDYNSSH